MIKQRLLDLFCGDGGAARGYAAAGFDVVGVDIVKRPKYPFDMIVADALTVDLSGFDVIHASPPCQGYSITRHSHTRPYPLLIEPVRDRLAATGKPYVIENVPGAPLRDPMTLCGSMFDLSAFDDDGTFLWLRRHRLFESNVVLTAPAKCVHPPNSATVRCGGVYSGGRRDKTEARDVRHGGYAPSTNIQRILMGLWGTTVKGLHEALPPVYTAHVGGQITQAIGG